MTTSLDTCLLGAHARHDKPALVGLYEQAAKDAAHHDAQAFYLTHAYVYALETGDSRADRLHAQLVSLGRES